MAFDTMEAATMDDAREMAAGRGRCLVLAPETFAQIEAADAAGAFEGGMTGNAGGAPFSAVGRDGDPSSSASDPPEPLDLDGAMVISLEGVVEKALELRDVIEAFAGKF